MSKQRVVRGTRILTELEIRNLSDGSFRGYVDKVRQVKKDLRMNLRADWEERTANPQEVEEIRAFDWLWGALTREKERRKSL